MDNHRKHQNHNTKNRNLWIMSQALRGLFYHRFLSKRSRGRLNIVEHELYADELKAAALVFDVNSPVKHPFSASLI